MAFEIFYMDERIKVSNINDLTRYQDKPVWIDITEITKRQAEILEQAFKIHTLTTEDLINKNTRIKVEEFNNYLFSVFYGVEKQKRLTFHEIDFILGKNFLITNHRSKIKSFEELKKQPEKIEKLLKQGTDFLFHKLLDLEIDNFIPLMDGFDDKIATAEEKSTKKPNQQVMNEILKLKHEIRHIKKIVLPQREKISFLAKNDYELISKKARIYFRDVYDHAVRVAENIETHKEAIGTAYDIYMSTVSNNMNEVMKVLSIIATIALPLTVISGIYGTNFTILPGSAQPYGFWIMILLMVFMGGGMILFFRKRGWF